MFPKEVVDNDFNLRRSGVQGRTLVFSIPEKRLNLSQFRSLVRKLEWVLAELEEQEERDNADDGK